MDGLTGTNRERPGLREALAACRAGDTLVVTKLDRLARSLPDAPEILDDLTKREVKLSLGGSVHDPTGVLPAVQPSGSSSSRTLTPGSFGSSLSSRWISSLNGSITPALAGRW